MFSSMRGKTKLCNYICCILALVLLAFQLFAPFWSVAGSDKAYSINGFVWLHPDESALVNEFTKMLNDGITPVTTAMKVASVVTVVVSCAAILLLCVFSVIFCIKKARNGMVAIVPALAAVAGILTFALNPVYRLGSSWVIQLIICVLLLAAAIATMVIGSKADKQERSGHKSSKADLDAKISAIKHMSIDLKELKGDITVQEVNFNRLLAYLRDEDEECRLAALEMLSNSSKEVAYTHIVHLMDSEESENVLKAMRAALISIKANMQA